MTNIRTTANLGVPNCPLCKNKMKVFIEGQEVYFYCIEPGCMVSINAKDPNIEQWGKHDEEMEKEILCEHCGADMNFFFRSDEFMKAVCQNKKCQASVQTEVIPDRIVNLVKKGAISKDE